MPRRNEIIRQQLVVTEVEYARLQNLLKVINSKTMSLPRRKIARAQYESLIRYIKSRPTNKKESSGIMKNNQNIG